MLYDMSKYFIEPEISKVAVAVEPLKICGSTAIPLAMFIVCTVVMLKLPLTK